MAKKQQLPKPEPKKVHCCDCRRFQRDTQSEQKKFIGNAVEVNQSRVLCEALAKVV